MSGVAVSFVTGSGALQHNNREYIHENVDSFRIENNINYKEETIQTAYEKCFGNSVEEYNKRQTRNDRKINNYMKKIEESGNKEKLFYENIVQVGDKYSHGFGSGNEQQAINILDEYAKKFQERNPSLYVFNMKMHLDEATPHLHIDYIPVASGYKKGLDTRNSLTKAHQNMGIDKGMGRNDNSTMKWQERERAVIKEIAKDHNLELINKNTDRKHLTVDEYKVYAEEIQKQYDKFIDKEIVITTGKLPFSDKVVLNRKEFEKLTNNAKYNILTDQTMTAYAEKLEKKEVELNNLSDKLKNRDNYYKFKEDALKNFISEKEEKIEGLESKYSNLYNKHSNLNKTNKTLERENKILKSETTKIEFLEQQVDNLAHNLTSVVQAINILLYDESDNYKLENISKKQKNLIKGIENYSKGWLLEADRDDLVKNVESEVGFSKGIEDSIDEINRLDRVKNKSLKRGGR